MPNKLVGPANWWAQQTGMPTKLLSSANWWAQQTGGLSKLVCPANWWAQQTSGPSKLVRPANWSAQQTGMPSKLLSSANWWSQQFKVLSKFGVIYFAVECLSTLYVIMCILCLSHCLYSAVWQFEHTYQLNLISFDSTSLMHLEVVTIFSKGKETTLRRMHATFYHNHTSVASEFTFVSL